MSVSLLLRLGILAVFSGALFAFSLPVGILGSSRWIVALLAYWPLAWGIAQCDNFKNNWSLQFTRGKQSFFVTSLLALFLCDFTTHLVVFHELILSTLERNQTGELQLKPFVHTIAFLLLLSIRLPLILSPLVILRDLRAHFRFFNLFPCWPFVAFTVILDTLLGQQFFWTTTSTLHQTWVDKSMALTHTEPLVNFFLYLPLYYIASNESIITKTVSQFLVKVMRPLFFGGFLVVLLGFLALISPSLVTPIKQYLHEIPKIYLYSTPQGLRHLTATEPYSLHIITHLSQTERVKHNFQTLAASFENSVLTTSMTPAFFQVFRPDGSSSGKIKPLHTPLFHSNSQQLRWIPGLQWILSRPPFAISTQPMATARQIPIVPITPSFSIFSIFAEDLWLFSLQKKSFTQLSTQNALIISTAHDLPFPAQFLHNIQAARTAHASYKTGKPLLYLCHRCQHRLYLNTQTYLLPQQPKIQVPAIQSPQQPKKIFWTQHMLMTVILFFSILFSLKSFFRKRNHEQPF